MEKIIVRKRPALERITDFENFQIRESDLLRSSRRTIYETFLKIKSCIADLKKERQSVVLLPNSKEKDRKLCEIKKRRAKVISNYQLVENYLANNHYDEDKEELKFLFDLCQKLKSKVPKDEYKTIVSQVGEVPRRIASHFGA